MAAGRLISLLATLFLSVSLLLLWFTLLSGITSTSPLRQTYFLRADTSGITGARGISQWTYFRICGIDNTDCGPARPGLPLGDAWATDADNVPRELIGSYGGGTTSYQYWYLWRFGWVFYLIALFFMTCAFLGSWLACLGRLGAGLIATVSSVGLLFLSVAVALMTATFVKTRNAFIADGRNADLGAYGFGFSWGSWAAMFIATVLYCVARRGHASDGVGRTNKRWSGSTFGRRKSSGTAGSRRSWDGRRVKDEYA
ncbi:Putative protein of unknown function [Podospora comata]|uniref:Protein SUR7 n=1 Tax=Podospora comata TaxID=48703 RepID=A0ABY6RXJ1_PODCO|nr:Putative protein of unknown function [Podospora comata]